MRVVNFRIALIEIARARAMTKKNQSRIIIFHLYFIRIRIVMMARANERTIEKKVEVGSSSGVSSPNGRSF